IPLAADLLRGAGLEPSTMEQPETVVAEGSVRLASGATGLTRPGSPVGAPPSPRPPADAYAGATDPNVGPTDPWHGEQPTPVLAIPPGSYPPSPSNPLPPPDPYPPPAPYPTDLYPPPAPYPAGGRAYPGRRRRRWLPVLLTVAVLVAGAAATALV